MVSNSENFNNGNGKERYMPPRLYETNIRDAFNYTDDLEAVYNKSVSQLREKFPTIPEDLTNKSINIRYEQENGIYLNVYLSSNALIVSEINNKFITINKNNGKRSGSAISKGEDGFDGVITEDEVFDIFDFSQGIDKIIKNADKCEIIFKELDSQKS